MEQKVFLDSPVGKLTLVERDGKLSFIQLFSHFNPADLPEILSPVLLETKKQLQEYFDGTRQKFDLPLSPQGTPFQSQVWQALLKIPYGETRSYQQIASMVGNPKACRAVGSANGKNPIMILIPCHRIITAGGKIGGYAGGLPMKKALLELETKRRSLL